MTAEAIKKNAPSDPHDIFYCLSIKLDDAKIVKTGYNLKEVYNYIDNVFLNGGYVKGKNNFWYTKPNDGTMFSFYHQLDELMENDFFKNSLITAQRYRKYSDTANHWYENDYAVEYYANKEWAKTVAI